MRLSGTKATALHQYRGLGNQLWDLAGNRPSLDLPFADNKSLVDATTGANLVDFTRASSGTYVDSEGVIRTATTNLLLRSEEFQTTWLGTGILAFGSGSIVNAIAAPNGTVTADLITEDATSPGLHSVNQNVTVDAGATTTFSCYIKAAGRNFCRLVIRNNASPSDSAFCFFDLANGTAGSPSSGGTGIQGGASIQNVGDGWYRCSLTGSVPTATTYQLNINLANSISNAFYTGDGTSGIYLWGAQLEQSTTVGEYVPTTSTINSAPRFDHDPVTGESLGLLIEEQRTNLLQRTEEFDNAVWNKVRTTVTPNAAIAPDGALTADFIAPTTDNDSHLVSQLVSTGASKTYSRSVFAKAAGYFQLTVRIAGSGWASTGSAAYVNLQTGAVTGPNPELLTLEEYPNGWFRISSSATTNATASSSRGILIAITQEDNISFTGDPTKGVYLWGGGLAEGAFATSYIKNIDTALGVTRQPDLCEIGGINFSSWYRQDEGTVLIDTQRTKINGFPRRFRFTDGTSANSIFSFWDASVNSSTFSITTSSVNQFAIFGSGGALETFVKAGFGLKNNDTAVFYDGNQTGGTQTSVSLPVVSKAEIASNAFNGWVKRFTYWPARLPNETLQTITQ